MGLGESELIKIWERVCAKFSFSCGIATFNSWIKPLELESVEGGIVYIKAPSRFIKDWVSTNFQEQLEAYLRAEIPNLIAVEYAVENRRLEANDLHISAIQEAENNRAILNNTNFDSTLDNRFKFENFVIGDSNNLAFNSVNSIVKGENLGTNTLFIYGNVGSGKTHLLQAAAHYLKENYSDKKAIYLSAEKFMFQFVKAIRERDMVSFKEYLRSTDILLIDDIQFICGKVNIQEEFIHTFNAIVENGKHIVLSADRAPSDFIDIDERIKSRLGWGLVADIKKPDVILRKNIVVKKAEGLNANLNENIVNFLAENINTNIRELEGALVKIVAQSRLSGKNIDIEFAMETLKDLLRGVRKELTIDEIKRIVCSAFEIRISDIESAKRDRKIARPRQVAMYLAKNLTTKSLPEIGRNFGSKNHTTVIHAIKTIEKLRASEIDFDNKLEQLSRKLAS